MMLGFATDVSDPVTQRTAFGWMNRSVQVWGQPAGADGASSTGIPGFERFMYERYVPAAFAVPANPAFNPKDGQSVVVSAVVLSLELQRLIARLRRSSTRSPTFYKRYANRVATRRTTSSSPRSSRRKTGQRTPRSN